MSRRSGGLLCALLSAATFGTSGSFASSLLDAGWSPAAVVLVRISVGALLLGIPAVISMRGRGGALRSSAGPMIVYGLLAVAVAQVCFFNAVAHVPVGVALLLEYLGIVLVVGWMWARHGQRPRGATVAGTAVVLVGLCFVLDLFGGVHFDIVGVLWGLGAAIGLAAYFVMSARPSQALPPVATAGLGMAIGSVMLAALGLAGVLPMHAALRSVHFAGHPMSWLVPIVGLSVIAAAVAYVAGIVAAVRLGPRLASFVGLTEVLFAVLFAWALLGQMPGAGQILGGVLILVGIGLVKTDETGAQPAMSGEAGVAEIGVEPIILRTG